MGDTQRWGAHSGVEVCRKPIDGVICQLDGLLVMFELEERHSRSKSFFFVDLQSVSLAQCQSIRGQRCELHGVSACWGLGGRSDHTAFGRCLQRGGGWAGEEGVMMILHHVLLACTLFKLFCAHMLK